MVVAVHENVVSPFARRTGDRRQLHRAGQAQRWLVDPTLRQVHLYEFGRDPAKAMRILDEDESFASPLLAGLSISAADLFRV